MLFGVLKIEQISEGLCRYIYNSYASATISYTYGIIMRYLK
jgi:hypothetical protein